MVQHEPSVCSVNLLSKQTVSKLDYTNILYLPSHKDNVHNMQKQHTQQLLAASEIKLRKETNVSANYSVVYFKYIATCEVLYC